MIKGVTDRSGLAAQKTKLSNPSEHVVLPNTISKEPLGPAVRQGDDSWANLARWVLNAMIVAEELGVNSNNVSSLRDDSENPEIQRLLGKSGDLASNIGLNPDWAYNIISQVGNYKESFDRNINPIGLSRGINKLWNKGGILYAPPFR